MKMFKALAGLGILLAGLYGAWLWMFCRIYVGPDEMAIVISKEGQDLPPDQILAREGQKGVRENVLGEGRYFLNPILFETRIEKALVIPPGKIGVVTAKVGKDLPQGEFLADVGEKGVWKNVLGPGKYRINPIGYEVTLEDALKIPIGYVGVVTSMSGAPAPEGAFSGADQKGVRADVLQPGLYFINPRQYKVDVLEVGVNQVSLLGKQGGEVLTKNVQMVQGANDDMTQRTLQKQMQKRQEYIAQSESISMDNSAAAPSRGGGLLSSIVSRKSASYGRGAPPSPQDQAAAAPQASPSSQAAFVLSQFVEFPSRDGFEISLDMTVEFELLPNRLAEVFRRYGDLPAVVEKAIMPQILSISRLKGSAYKATDFIVGEGREAFQKDLTSELERTLEDRGIKIHNAIIRHVNVPDQILQPIQQASVAVEQDLTNKERQNTARKLADLNREQAMIEQFGQQVIQETEKLKAEIRAEQERKVAQIAAETTKRVSEIESKTAGVRADVTRKIGQAKADTVKLVDGERARGFQMKVQAFGDAHAYSLWEFARNLDPKLRVRVIHAGEGTLWTDLEKQSLGELGGASLLQGMQAPPAPKR